MIWIGWHGCMVMMALSGLSMEEDVVNVEAYELAPGRWECGHYADHNHKNPKEFFG